MERVQSERARRLAEEAQKKREIKKRLEEEHRMTIEKHLQEQDNRLRLANLQKAVDKEKRLVDAFDPTPARREMYDDKVLAMKATIPGPGEYTPRLRSKDSSGKTFSAIPFDQSMSNVGSSLDGLESQRLAAEPRDLVSPASWRIKDATTQPSPASYNPLRSPRYGATGTTFGLPPELLDGKTVRSAHPDGMARMTQHLRAFPAPNAYSPRHETANKTVADRNGMERNLAFRMVPSKAPSTLEQVMTASAKVPGPGTYEDQSFSQLSPGRSNTLHGSGIIKTDLQIQMERAEQLPGPGAYQHFSQLRFTGAPRFGTNETPSLIEAIQKEARVRASS